MVMIPLGLFSIALLVRLGVGVLFAGPAYPDSYFYAHVAQQLAAGHGFTADYVWNLDDIGGRLPALGTLPIPTNALWMPLAELVQVPSIWLFGPTSLAASLPFALIGAFAAPLTYWMGIDAGLGRHASTAAGLLSAVPAGLTPFVAQPDNFALMMVLGPLSLWLCTRGARGDRRSFVVGGLVVGLATLARTDAALLGVPFVVVAVRDRWRHPAPVVGWGAAVGCAVAFALVLAPWLIRQAAVFGSFAPSASSGRLLWLTDYQQLFSLANPPSMDNWVAQGFGWLVTSRVGGLVAAIGTFALLPMAIVLTPFAVIGGWVRRRDGAFAPFFVYAAVFLAVTSLMFPVFVLHGTYIHSAAALVPHAFLLVGAGIAASVGWVARWHRTWDVDRATRFFEYGAVIVAVMAAGLQTLSTTHRWAEVRAVEVSLVVPLSKANPDDRFMAADPGAINYLTGRPGIVTPADTLPEIETAMRVYDVRWLVLERSSIVPALVPVLTGELHPAWLSAPVAQISDLGATYAVCFQAEDARCAR